jgi:hypothetical protein
MKKLLLGVAASAALLAAGAASAAVTTEIWVDQSGVASDTTFANVAGLGAASATTSVADIFFDTNDFGVGATSDNVTIDQFLGTSIGGTVGNHLLDNTVFRFTGTLFLNSGDNSFVVAHDDGLQLNIDGFGLVVDAPGPTGEDDTPFTVHASTAGNYNFQMVYGECCGGPAVIKFEVNNQAVSGAPEPATWALMILGFGAAGGMLRRSRQVAKLA